MNENFNLEFNSDIGATILTFTNRCSPEEFQKAYKAMLNLFLESKTTKHITDTSKMGVVSVDNQKWVGKEIVSKMKSSIPSDSKLNVGLVLGNDIFATVAAKNIERISEEESKMIVKEFPSISDAKDWIKTK